MFSSQTTYLAILLLFILQPILIKSQTLTPCKTQCEENRPIGSKESYKFNCDRAYQSPEDIEKCKWACETCSKEYCDEYIDANQWHCPSAAETDINQCRQCNNYRPKGIRENFTLDCSTEADPDICKRNSGDCPKFIHRKEKSENLFYCPDVSFPTDALKCKAECDKFRQLGVTEKYSFKCAEKYVGDDTGMMACDYTLAFECPDWVKNNGEYNCPTLEISGNCQQFCDQNRENSDLKPYKLDCKQLYENSPNWQMDCQAKCDQCKSLFQFGDNPICDSTNPKEFHCPRKEPENETPTGRPSYKGPCKDRCERNRGGGILDFIIDCKDRFESNGEKLACENDCTNHCPDDDVCRTNSKGKEIYCKEQKDKVREKKQKEEKEQKEHEEGLKREEKLRQRYERQTENSLKIWIPVTILLFLIVFASFFGKWYLQHQKYKKNVLLLEKRLQMKKLQREQGYQGPGPWDVQTTSTTTTL